MSMTSSAARVALLHVSDASGDRVVTIDRSPFTLGRRETNHARTNGTEVSREHAHITNDGTRFVLHDLESRYGTFVNDVQVTEHVLRPGDRIRLGRGGGAEVVFDFEGSSKELSTPSRSNPVGDIQIASALLEGLRAIGPGRVLQDVLTLVVDSAIAMSGAERGFIMLASPEGVLEFKLARCQGKRALGDATFETSHKIPEAAFTTGRTQIVTDLLGDPAGAHAETAALGIRQVLCAPLHVARFADTLGSSADEERIGVLYLDGRSRDILHSGSVRAGLETLAAEAAVAIENARLYRAAAEHAAVEQELRIAAEIQRLLMPHTAIDRPFAGAAAASLPCRSIGGDFFDYADRTDRGFAFTLGDVSGKGPGAALLSALLQGMFSLEGRGAASPASVMSRVNGALCERAIESRFATVFYGVLNPCGRLVYCNAGHNPPFVFGPSGVQRLRAGGPIIGYQTSSIYGEGNVQLAPGDRIVVFSDGVSDAFSPAGEEFGDDRILALLESACGMSDEMDATSLVGSLVGAVRDFTLGAPQSDDITAMVVQYRDTSP